MSVVTPIVDDLDEETNGILDWKALDVLHADGTRSSTGVQYLEWSPGRENPRVLFMPDNVDVCLEKISTVVRDADQVAALTVFMSNEVFFRSYLNSLVIGMPSERPERDEHARRLHFFKDRWDDHRRAEIVSICQHDTPSRRSRFI